MCVCMTRVAIVLSLRTPHSSATQDKPPLLPITTVGLITEPCPLPPCHCREGSLLREEGPVNYGPVVALTEY